MICSASIANDTGNSITYTTPSTPAKWPDAADQTLKGWSRNTEMLPFGIDQYLTKNGSITLDLVAFPPTDKSAAQWIDAAIPVLLKKYKDSGRKVSELDSHNENVDGADVAVRTFMRLKESRSGKTRFLYMIAIVRSGFPVQFSVTTLGDVNPTDEQNQQANAIRLSANMPYNNNAEFLGLEAMLTLAAGTLFFDHQADKKAEPNKRAQKKPLKKKQTKKKQSKKKSSKKQQPKMAASSDNNLAPKFSPFPGPQIQLTGKWLGSLPAGYRFDGWTTHYWTNQAMTATKTFKLKLTRDGQFEVSNFSIIGGSGGVTGVITSSDKHGSVGTVSGNTNPAGAGAASVALIKKNGLDASKYGTYFISGNQIEMRFANGKTVRKSFKTDGHHEMVVGGNRYFMHSPRGWERRNTKNNSRYRSIDGRYHAIVSHADNNISNGKAWMERYLKRIGSKRWFVSAGPVKLYNGRVKSYNVARVSAVLVNEHGYKYNIDYYLKFGRTQNKFIQMQPYAGAKDDDRILEFLYRI